MHVGDQETVNQNQATTAPCGVFTTAVKSGKDACVRKKRKNEKSPCWLISRRVMLALVVLVVVGVVSLVFVVVDGCGGRADWSDWRNS